MAAKITKEIQGRIDKARRMAEEGPKMPDPYAGMSEDEIEECHGLVVNSDPEALKKHILEWWENDNKIQREN